MADNQAGRHQQPIVISAANGVTQVNIQTPNNKGLSHNKYSQFDVSQQGAILNNSSKISQTQIAGYVQGNELLNKTGPAKIILNEVNSRNPSQLNGVVEVAGQKAEVIIANPSGITCNGCGFINASRGTLTTGKPIINNGEINGYQVEQGHITVTGKGLDSSGQNYTDLIARTVSINSAIWANEANVITGRNQVSYDTQTIMPLDNATDNKPEVSIDVSQLGGMYANSIRMIGTEKGVGVHNAGELGASAGSIVISADGKITNQGAIQAQQSINFTSQNDIVNQKHINSRQSIQLTSQGAIVNEGNIVAKKNVDLKSKTINSTSTSLLAAGIDEEGKLTQKSDIIAQAENISLTGKNLAGQRIKIDAQKSVDLTNSQNVAQTVTFSAENINISHAKINSEQEINLHATYSIDSRNIQAKTQTRYVAKAKLIDNQQSTILANDDITFSADKINNAQSKLNAGKGIYFNAQYAIDNDHATLLAEGAIHLQSQDITNNDSLLVSNDQLQIKADTLANRQSILQSKKYLNIDSVFFDNQQSQLLTEDSLTINATHKVNNQHASLSAKGTINIASKYVDNNAATFISENAIKINVQQFFNQYAKLTALNGIFIDGQQIDNQSAELKTNGYLSINSTQLNNESAKLIAVDDVNMNSSSINNSNTNIITTGKLSLHGKDINNEQANIQAAKLISIYANNINNASALLLTNASLELNGESINNNNAELNASDRIMITAQQLFANQGLIASNGNIDINSHTIDAQQVKIKGKQGIELNADNNIDVTNGLIISEKQVSINADNIKLNTATLSAKDDIAITAVSQLDNNDSKWISEGKTTVNTQIFNNQNSSISSYKNILFKTLNLNNINSQLLSYGAITLNSNIINNQNALINALANIQILADKINNQNAQIIGQDSIAIHANTMNNRDIALQSAKALLMVATESLDNSHATLIAGEQLKLAAQQIDNNNAKIKSAHDLVMQATNINNQQSTMIAVGNVVFDVKDLLNNQQADIRAQGQMEMNANVINNYNNLLAASKSITLNANELNSQSATLKADDSLNIKAKKIDSSLSKWVSLNKITVESEDINNQKAIIKANSDISIKTNQINNDNATLIAGGEISFYVNELSNQLAYFNADKAIHIQTNQLNNQTATLISNDSIEINAANTNNQQATLSAKQNIIVKSDEINNQQALWLADNVIKINGFNLNNQDAALQAKGGMQINVNGNINNEKATLVAGQNGLIIHANDLDNEAAELSSKGLLSITTNSVNNHRAQLIAESDLNIQSNEINNQSADIQAKGELALNAKTMNNNEAKLLSVGNIILNAENNLINNSAQLTALQQIKLQTQGAIDNQHSTLMANQGIFIKADTINNSESKLETASLLKIIANDVINYHAILNADQIELESQALDNQLANFIAKNILNIQANNVINSQAYLLAKDIAIVANQLTGDGELRAENSIILNLMNGFNNIKSLIANNQISIKANQINNQGKISSGQSVTLTSDIGKNTQNGIIESQKIDISGNRFVNQGLIDGEDVNIDLTQQFDNLDAARLYGDTIHIKANEVNNNAAALNSPITPTIAARQSLLLDVNTINNTNHALLLSLGDMQINGKTLNNHSARIESTNNMRLNVSQINNINDHIETDDVLISSQPITEYTPMGHARRFKPEEVTIRTSPKKRHRYPVLHSNKGEFGSTYKYHEYRYTKNIYETKIKVSEPAEIISGNDLIIQAHHIENDNSKILAGNNLLVTTDTLNNYSLKGKRTITDIGTQIWHYRNKHNHNGKAVYTTGEDESKYFNQSITTIDLQHAKMEDHTNINNSKLTPTERETIHVAAGQAIQTINKDVKADQQLDGLSDSLIAKGKEKGDITIAEAKPITDLSQGKTTIKTEKVDNQNTSVIDNNVNQHPSIDSVNKQQYTESISYTEPNTSLPKNSIYIVNKSPESNYLIETDSRFTNRKKWLSSDYMLNRLRVDPNNIQKRLGDGYYEQQLIREQIVTLTGQRYLGDYSSDLEQYKALMDAGIAFAEHYGLPIGASLSADQMRLLTTDMVWMESKTVIVDGQAVTVLVPQVYLVNHARVNTDGALLAGKNVTVYATDDIDSSGLILGKDRVAIAANNVNNRGTIDANSIVINAKDSINSSGKFNADKLVYLSANNDINLNSTTSTTASYYGQNKSVNTVIDQVSSINVKDGDIRLKAGNDINLGAALLINEGKEGKTNLIAGHDINLSTLKTESNQEAFWDKNNYRKVDIENIVGSEIFTNGDLNLIAGNDIRMKSADIASNQSLNLLAQHDIDISSDQERLSLSEHHKSTSKGLLNKQSITEHTEIDNTTQKGSSLSANSITIYAGNNLTVTGSQVVGTHDVNLYADKDITINAAEESYYKQEQTIKKKSGLMSGGGIGVTVGKEKESLKQTDTEQAYVGSVVGSTDGSVNIHAGKNINVEGSDIIAQKDANLIAQNIDINSLDAKTTYKEEYSYEKSGLTVALTGTAADMYEAAKAVERAKEKGNDRLLALQSIKSGLSAVGAVEDLQLKNQEGQSQASIGVSAMFGTQRTEREVNQEQHSVISSGVSAGRNINIIATGDEQHQGGDISIKGSDIKAGNDINLTANRDLNVIGAVNTQHSDSDEKSYGGGVGIQFQVGGDESGLRFKGNANFSRERENADGSAWTESVIDAKNKLNIKTGNDVNIIGGQLKGDTVKMNVGNNLNIQSLQDTDDYDYEKISASVSGTAGSGFSANGSISATNIDSKWASVTDQSGIFAGKGGYDIYVGNNTDLKGAVIASEAVDTNKNKLDTGTISFSDIENKADFKVTQVSISGGTGGPGVPTAYQNSDKDSSTTKSAVENGQLIIRNQDEQKQDINELSRDTESANNPLKQIFDKQKELDKIETVELIKDIAQQTKDVVNKYDRIQAQNDVDKNKDALSRLEAAKAYEKLTDDEKAKISFEKYYEDNKDYWYYSAVDTQLASNLKNGKNLGTMGGDVSKGIDSAVAIVTGIISGDITGGLAGASAPWLAEQIKKHTGHMDENGNWVTDNVAGNLVTHAILGAVVAELQGNSGLSGGLGAVGGELAAQVIRKTFYGDKNDNELTEAEKQNISALAQLATGLAIAVAGGDVGDAGTAIAAGKNAVENNSLVTLPLEACAITAPCRGFVAKKILEYGIKAGITAIVAKEIADNISSEDLEHLIILNMMGNDEITNRYLGELKDKYATTIAIDPNDERFKPEGYPISEEPKPIIISTPIPEQDKDAGKLVTPIIEQDKNSGILAGPEIEIRDWRDFILTSDNVQEKPVGSLIGIQGKNEVSGSDIKRYAEDMKENGFDKSQPIDVVIIDGKMIIIDGHHRAAAAKLAGIKDVPVRINEVTSKEAADEILIWAAEAKTRY
ncbi:hemagglutinin repeat-containing protein [Gilliamella sp. B2838]|uniref:two-partner secretion domain-containing protein n=1 Tax=Gilliamella sp. B2838 TaxID=2818020 RepID=UPI0022698FC5|nr:hemagglutinin repeat-containing protein [Gilliamella sp. B2838]MCX8728650.1 hemagglutinin repeat-containing protein [Gilliamella sp. B2838]